MNIPTLISVEGIILPNRPLANVELINSAKKLHIPLFRGVFVRDDLPRKPNKNECGILNLDDSSGGGTHWVLWYKKNNENFYFDSYGIDPPLELRQYLKGYIFCNTENIQTEGEVFCGHLCLYVLKQLSLGRHLQEIVNNLQ